MSTEIGSKNNQRAHHAARLVGAVGIGTAAYTASQTSSMAKQQAAAINNLNNFYNHVAHTSKHEVLNSDMVDKLRKQAKPIAEEVDKAMARIRKSHKLLVGSSVAIVGSVVARRVLDRQAKKQGMSTTQYLKK